MPGFPRFKIGGEVSAAQENVSSARSFLSELSNWTRGKSCRSSELEAYRSAKALTGNHNHGRADGSIPIKA